MNKIHKTSKHLMLVISLFCAFLGQLGAAQAISNQPNPEIVISPGNFKQLKKTGLHLYPGEYVGFRKKGVDCDINVFNNPKTWDGPALLPVYTTADKTEVYKAGILGTTAVVQLDRAHPEMLLLWWTPAIMETREIDVVVDQPVPR